MASHNQTRIGIHKGFNNKLAIEKATDLVSVAFYYLILNIIIRIKRFILFI